MSEEKQYIASVQKDIHGPSTNNHKVNPLHEYNKDSKVLYITHIEQHPQTKTSKSKQQTNYYLHSISF